MNIRRYICLDCGSTNIDRARCREDLCKDYIFSRGMCKAHYQRWYRRATGEVVDENPFQELEEAPGFWERVDTATRERVGL